ncbi:MAG: hypothetical protein U1F11_04750 [Steroidobacteraceae bacterium]
MVQNLQIGAMPVGQLDGLDVEPHDAAAVDLAGGQQHVGFLGAARRCS